MQAKAYETELTAVSLKDLAYAVDTIRLYARDSDGNVTQVAEDTSGYAQGDTVTLEFEAPNADNSPYDLAAKADVSGSTRTLFQASDALRVSQDIGS